MGCNSQSRVVSGATGRRMAADGRNAEADSVSGPHHRAWAERPWRQTNRDQDNHLENKLPPGSRNLQHKESSAVSTDFNANMYLDIESKSCFKTHGLHCCMSICNHRSRNHLTFGITFLWLAVSRCPINWKRKVICTFCSWHKQKLSAKLAQFSSTPIISKGKY